MAGSVFVGLTTLDLVQYDAEPVRPGHKTTAARSWLGAGGPAANAAVCCAHLTGGATLVTAIGRGPAAGLVRAELAGLGVTLVDCAPAGYTLPAAVVVVTRDGERTVVSPGARSSPVTATADALTAMAAADVLLVDGHHPGLGQDARAVAPPRGTPGRPLVVADAGSVKPVLQDWLTDWIDVLAGSADYAAGLGVSVAQAGRHALARGATAAVVTDGAGPVHWARRSGSPAPDAGGPGTEPAGAQGDVVTGTHQPPGVHARDTLGAGDAFHGALVAALAGAHWQSRLPEAVHRAAAVASTAVADPSARGWLTPELSAAWRGEPA